MFINFYVFILNKNTIYMNKPLESSRFSGFFSLCIRKPVWDPIFESDFCHFSARCLDWYNYVKEEGTGYGRVYFSDIFFVIYISVSQQFLGHNEITGFLDKLIVVDRMGFLTLELRKFCLNLSEFSSDLFSLNNVLGFWRFFVPV